MTMTKTYSPKVPCHSKFHDIRGIQYHVNEWGERGKPLLVLLHGWGDCGRSFQFLVDEFRHDWFVIAPDWRGFGHTLDAAANFWFPDYLNDLDLLLNIYQAERPVAILGHSMGGNAASLYAGIMPERVAALVNVEGFGLPESNAENAPMAYRRWIEQSRSKPVYAEYAEFEQLAEKIQLRSPKMTPDKALFVAGLWASRHEDGVVRIRANPAHKLPGATQYRRAEAMACWSRIEAPVQKVLGADTIYKEAAKNWLAPEESSGRYAEAEIHVIEHAGHMLHFEQPAQLASVAEGFFHRFRRRADGAGQVV